MRSEDELRGVIRASTDALRKQRTQARNVVSELEKWKARAEAAEANIKDLLAVIEIMRDHCADGMDVMDQAVVAATAILPFADQREMKMHEPCGTCGKAVCECAG